MPLDDEICYRAAAARDARFDGQFFTGVTSTGIFCRPVCPARTPGRDRCRFFPSAAAALDAGFRPCLRCRPEVSPDMPAWLGTSSTVSRALRLIHAGALDDRDVESLATRTGIGARHLRRLFEEHLGASPVAVAQARRLLFAKRLLRETELTLTDVAMAAGFGSLRRFNDLFLNTYGRSPGALRRGLREDGVAGSPAIELRLDYHPPYDWAGVAAFLARRALPGVEVATANSYSRTIRIGEKDAGRITVRPAPWGEAALLTRIELPSVASLRETVERLHRVFDLRVAPHSVAAQLGELAVPGIRLPGAWDVFELAVRAILGQQISVAAATTFATRMVERWGEDAPALPGEPNRLFPAPRVLADAPVAEIGLPGARATAIMELARAATQGALDFPPLAPLDEIVRRLCTLRGIGEWTAQYIAMRAFGEPDAFPAADLVLRKAMGGITEKQLLARAEAWRPWRAYAVFSLWQRS